MIKFGSLSQFKQIVWATDGSEHADRALDYAKHLAQLDGTSLEVVHVVDKFGGEKSPGRRCAPTKLDRKKAKAQADALLEQGFTSALTIASELGAQPPHWSQTSRRNLGLI